MTNSLQPAYALVPGANLEAYVHTVNSIPLLTPEQERELAESLYYEQDLGGGSADGARPPAFCRTHCP